MKSKNLFLLILAFSVVIIGLSLFLSLEKAKVQLPPESGLGTSAILPDEKAGLAAPPDLRLISMPKQPLSVKFVIEHRSALNGKAIEVQGVVVRTLLGEKACPQTGLAGLCAKPSLYLADTPEEERDKLYDLRVLMSEAEQEKDYPLGKKNHD